MNSKLQLLYKTLSTKEESGKKIGLFRIISAIFGGLLVSYIGMTLLVYLLPGSASETVVIPLMFNTIAWSITALWISLSETKLIALYRIFIPSIIFTIAISFFTMGA